MRRTTMAAAVLAGLIVLSGCSAEAAPPAQPGASAPGVSVGQPAEANDVDTHFIAMMTPHHAQAVEMSEIILAVEGVSEATRDLAQRILDGQQAEIDTMLGWAERWGLAELMTMHSVHIANGMLMPEQMEALRAQPAEAEELFLELMHSHHEGALQMTEDQIARGGYTPLVDLAGQMVTVQTAEMLEIDGMLGR